METETISTLRNILLVIIIASVAIIILGFVLGLFGETPSLIKSLARRAIGW